MKGFIGYTVVVIVSGAVCGTLDRYGIVTAPVFYWLVGFLSGIVATSIMYKG